ncbi:WhiB family transcriptional regulator [Nocardiopsis sp. CNT312]|uniref:WhiB family transcriptional regulator n=1 Tax=Nocardiopsis sp. CNT312 TaxID=1137268 RepID=UPI0004AF5CBE|nr:WhiB family transcriptional regulator [Nocardiopsis sp. CNT312]
MTPNSPRRREAGVPAPGLAWIEQALCAHSPRPDRWHPEQETEDTVYQACVWCAACPVADQCLATALAARRPVTGVWAGTTTRQRRRIRHRSADTPHAA